MTAVSYEGRDLEVFASSMANYYAWIMEAFSPYIHGDVIEYGAGIGTMSELVAPLSETLTLVEPSSNLLAPLRSRFGKESKVTVEGESLESHVANLGGNTVDTVIMVNVLEHIEDDQAALLNLFRVLRPGGHLLIFVPALQFLMSRVDLMHGHFRRYHRPDLKAKITAAGGDILTCRYFDLAGVGPWLLLNKIMGSTSFNPTLVNFHDRAVVPISRALESVFEPPFGKNLLLVACKP